MNHRRSVGFLLGGTLAVAIVAPAAWATPPSGATGTVLAQGTIEERIKIKTRPHQDSVVTVQKVTIQPGGSTGWHSHDAEVLAVVGAGTLTLTDHHCSVRTVATGHGFTEDPGEVHVARNLGQVNVDVYVTYVHRPGAALRVDEPAPRRCSA
jgi:quercetin dioxygenase-like cupin family protein